MDSEEAIYKHLISLKEVILLLRFDIWVQDFNKTDVTFSINLVLHLL